MTRGRIAVALAVLMAGVTVAGTIGSALAAPAYPNAVYPVSVVSHGGALRRCPSAAGLQAFSRAARAVASRHALEYGRRGLLTDLRRSDRAWWHDVRTMWAGGRTAPTDRVVVKGATAAATSGYAVIVRHSCGGALVDASLMVTVGPSAPAGKPQCVACNTHLFMVDRRGHPLIYFLY